MGESEMVRSIRFETIVSGRKKFRNVYDAFMARDLTREDMRDIIRRSLTLSRGRYRRAVLLLGLTPNDYKWFMNMMDAHGIRVDFRPYRHGVKDAN